jgi:hypothetical protein
VRAARLGHRSPDLWSQPAEVAHRLDEPADHVFDVAHLVIENFGDLEDVAKAELVAIVRALVA